MKSNVYLLVVAICGFSAPTASSEQKTAVNELDDKVRQLLMLGTRDDADLRRVTAGDVCIAMLKKNRAWRVDPFDWKVPTEERIRRAGREVASSKQAPDLALANMCAHCIGTLIAGTWRAPPKQEEDPLEKQIVGIVQNGNDPVVRMMLLLGLASSDTQAARDAIVAATDDADLGVRKGANYLIQKCTANSFGPLGSIHIGSPAEDVAASGQKIRSIYKWDKTLGEGWGPMEDGLQTMLAIKRIDARAGARMSGSLIVRNVSTEPKSAHCKYHPVLHLRILRNKQYVWPDIPAPPTPPATINLAPGEQKTIWSFRLNDIIEISKPGKYEVWLRDTDGWLPPQSNRVLFEIESPNRSVQPNG